MKRFITAILCVVLLVSAVSAVAETTVDLTAMSVEQLKELRDAVYAELATRGPEIKAATEYEATRKNPAPIGATAYFNSQNKYKQYEAELTVTSVLRGQEAADLITGLNMFNDAPEAGKEYIIAYMDVYLLPSDSEETVSFNGIEFEFVSQNGTTYDWCMVSCGDLEMPEMYPGGEGSGIVVGLIDEGDMPMMVYGTYFDEPVWFDLNSVIAE